MNKEVTVMFSNKSIKADNAILLAAGYARRFAPLSDRCPKGLLPVRGEVLIERQIRQLLASRRSSSSPDIRVRCLPTWRTGMT